MGLRDKLNTDAAKGDFNAFIDALESGVGEEIDIKLDIKLQPIKQQLEEIVTKLAEVGIAIENAQNSADSAASIASNALTAANTNRGTGGSSGGGGTTPLPTPSVTPSSRAQEEQGQGGTPPPTPSVTPTPAPIDKLIGISVEPLAATTTVGQITGATLYRTGDQATLRVASLPTGYTLDGWYNAAGQRVSTTQEYTFTVQQSENFILKFTQIDTNTSTDGRVNVTIKWNGLTSGARTQNGEFVRRMRIGTNPGNVTRADRDVTFASNTSPGQYPTSISTRVLPGTQVVLNAYDGIDGIIGIRWRVEGTSQNLKDGSEFRPTITSDITYVAFFT